MIVLARLLVSLIRQSQSSLPSWNPARVPTSTLDSVLATAPEKAQTNSLGHDLQALQGVSSCRVVANGDANSLLVQQCSQMLQRIYLENQKLPIQQDYSGPGMPHHFQRSLSKDRREVRFATHSGDEAFMTTRQAARYGM